jgi:nitroreductase
MSSSAPDIHALIRRATRAPSSHNTQPWRFRIHGGGHGLDLLADCGRRLPVNDPDDREMTLSCGCALMNLRVAAAAAGLGAVVTALPDPSRPDLLARIALDPEAPPDATLASLAPAIDQRHTNRGDFRPAAVAAGQTKRLMAAAAAEGAWLELVAGPANRAAVAGLVSAGDAAQWSDPAWRRELAAWLRPRGRGDGLSLPRLLVPVARFSVARFDLGRRVGRRDRRLAETAPLLAVLGTGADDTPARLAAGQALARVLLTATADGLAASYLNQPVQVAALRPRLATLLGAGPAASSGRGCPQVLLRLGIAKKPSAASPRRPVGAVIDGDADGGGT